jgi:hypothetical protein
VPSKNYSNVVRTRFCVTYFIVAQTKNRERILDSTILLFSTSTSNDNSMEKVLPLFALSPHQSYSVHRSLKSNNNNDHDTRH